MKKIILILGIIFLLVGVSINSSIGIIIDKKSNKPRCTDNTLYVGGEGPGNFTQIQDAIDHAYDGDTIFVYHGIYKEHLTIKKKINLIGENKTSTIIQGKNEDEDLVYVESDMVNINGFTILHSTYLNYGIYVSDSEYCCISNCILRSINSMDAICLRYSNNNHILNCSISNSNADIRISDSQGNIISNCSLKGSKADIEIIHSSNNFISNCCLDEGSLLIRDSWDNIISSCKIFDNINEGGIGIQISYSTNCTFRNNSLENLGIIFNVNFLYEYYHDIDTSNTIDGKPIYYLLEECNREFNATMDIGYIGLISCKNITVKNISLYSAVIGNTSSTTIKDCSFYQNFYGVDIGLSMNNLVTNCDFSIYNPVRIFKSSNNIISDCKMLIGSEYGFGVYIDYYSSNNIVSNCSISNFDVGILIGGESHNNTVVGCNISYNDQCGIWVSSSNNIVYHNNLLYNTLNALDGDKNNIWDDGKYGNFWSDYEERYPYAKPKLLKPWMWNIPYKIEGWNSKDNCPLVNQWPKPKSKDIPNNKVILSSPLLRFLERYALIQYILQRIEL